MQQACYFSNEGQQIAGTVHIPDGPGPFPGVLLCHGFTGQRIEAHFIFVKMSRALEQAGIASLRFDFRGSGESEGRFQGSSSATISSPGTSSWLDAPKGCPPAAGCRKSFARRLSKPLLTAGRRCCFSTAGVMPI